MTLTLIAEILILWACYAVYMATLVVGRGPVGGLFFYPKAVQERVITLGLVTDKKNRQRKIFAFTLLTAWLTVIPFFMIVVHNGARTFWECAWQFYVLFLGAEFFDWLFIDTLWVTISPWWIIPGTEDLLATWHNPKLKALKMPRLIVAGIPVAALVGLLFWLCSRVLFR